MLKDSYKAILFDLDGTLLPMDMKKFTEGYFTELYKKVNMPELPAQDFINAVWAGTHAMMKNDGSKTNREVFWDCFEKLTGISTPDIEPVCQDFYDNEFKGAVKFTMPNPLAKEAVKTAHEKVEKVVLATNPIFPKNAQEARLEWLGMSFSDFDLVTYYEEEHFAKPNPEFFNSLLKRMELKPEECLMIGNDEREDMYCATQAGIDCYLVTDTMIANPDYTWNGDKGTFEEMIEMLGKLK